MTDKELANRVFEVFWQKLKIWTSEISHEWESQSSWDKAREVVDRLEVRWDNYMRVLGAKRINAHPPKDPPAGWLKVVDPFYMDVECGPARIPFSGRRPQRLFLLERDLALRILFVGLP
jgi:hypothetical protein